MINAMKRLAAATCGMCLALLAGTASAQSQYTGITVFGDSLSDPGNLPKLLGINYPPPPYFEHQLSNGPVYAKYLDGLFGIATPLQDYAIAGAKSGVGNVAHLPGNPKIGLPNSGIDGEITYYLASNPTPRRSDLFVVWGGADDYFDALTTITQTNLTGGALKTYLTSPTGPVTQTVSNLVTDIGRLTRIGVKNFAVANLPGLGATPDFNGNPLSAEQANATVNVHNEALAKALGLLQQQQHVNITIVDVGAVFQDVLANPTKYGVDPNHLGDQCILSAACVAKHENYLFWSGAHPTGLVQQEISQIFFASLSGPTTVGAEMDLDKIVQQDLFDHVSARTAALRLGAAGLNVGGAGASGSIGGSSDHKLAVYITDSYGWGSRDSRQDVVGFDYHHNMTSGGVDYRINDWAAVGGLIGYSETGDTLHNSMGSQSFNSYQAAIYATAFADGWYGSLSGTYAYDTWDKVNRNVFLGGQTAAAQTNGHVLGGKLDGGYVMRAGDLSFGPTAELRLADYRIGSYTEHGAVGVNQEVDGQSLTSTIAQFGVQATWTTSIGSYAVTPQLRASFDHEFRQPTRAIVTRIASQLSTSVTTDLSPDGQDWARLGAGVAVQMTDAVSALIDFDTSAGRSGGEDYNALLRLKASF